MRPGANMATRRLSILTVDDDSTTVRMVSKYLLSEFNDRIALQTFIDPFEAKNWISNHSCDIVISDIEMPQMNGLELLKFAKNRNAWTQVVFMTAHTSWDRISAAIENGATDYLVKPIEREDLITVVAQELRRIERWQNAVLNTLRLSDPLEVG
jgi:DNA-binding NtrC family response regulator